MPFAGQQKQGGASYLRCIILPILTYCFLRNLAYICFRNLRDSVQPLKEEQILPTIEQNNERCCSTQIIITVLKEESGIEKTNFGGKVE